MDVPNPYPKVPCHSKEFCVAIDCLTNGCGLVMLHLIVEQL